MDTISRIIQFLDSMKGDELPADFNFRVDSIIASLHEQSLTPSDDFIGMTSNIVSLIGETEHDEPVDIFLDHFDLMVEFLVATENSEPLAMFYAFVKKFYSEEEDPVAPGILNETELDAPNTIVDLPGNSFPVQQPLFGDIEVTTIKSNRGGVRRTRKAILLKKEREEALRDQVELQTDFDLEVTSRYQKPGRFSYDPT